MEIKADLLDFQPVENVSKIIGILKERFPLSSPVYNLALMKQDFGDLIEFYLLNLAKESSINEESVWIMTKYARIDYGVFINISAPKSLKNLEIVGEIFENSGYIDWRNSYTFSNIDERIYPWLVDLSARIKGHVTNVYPKYFYLMDPEKAQKLSVEPANLKNGLTLQKMEVKSGLEFFLKTWKYSKIGSRPYFKQLLKKSETSGIYNKDGRPVSGIALGTNGLIALLHTDQEFRGQGLAKIVVKDLCSKMTSRGMIPCSCVEMENEISGRFHENLGFEKLGPMFYINYQKS